jgi:hypothetical protein
VIIIATSNARAITFTGTTHVATDRTASIAKTDAREIRAQTIIIIARKIHTKDARVIICIGTTHVETSKEQANIAKTDATTIPAKITITTIITQIAHITHIKIA